MQAAHQASIENCDEETLLKYYDSDEKLSADEKDLWSPDAAVLDIFDGADTEENPDLLNIQSAESKVSSCIYDFTASAVPDLGIKLNPRKETSLR